jgi:hypothetical protein
MGTDNSEGGAGGGGGAGGPSFAVDPSASVGLATTPGDGWLELDWAPGVPTSSAVSVPGSVPQGAAVTLTDTLTPFRSVQPAPTGTVTFEQVDPATKATTLLGTADVVDGQASLDAVLSGAGPQAVQAVYSGDDTYDPSTSGYALTTVVVPAPSSTPAPPSVPAPAITRITPNHGPKAGGTKVTITGRNLSGVSAIRIGGAIMRSVTCTSSTTCTAVTPRGSGTKAIRVTTPAGTSPFTAADRFGYR